jgi:hypothetical protein
MTDEYVVDETGERLVDGGYPRLRRRYEHYKIGYQRYKRVYLRSLLIAIGLGVLCAMLTALLVSAWMTRDRIENENIALLRQIGSLEVRLAGAESRLQTSRPLGLLAFEYDVLVPVRDSYVKAIELSPPHSLSGAIGFQLLLENTRGQDLAPDVTLELFDRSGSVVGTHKLEVHGAGVMRAGSTHSVSGTFTESAHPRVAFFRVKAR